MGLRRRGRGLKRAAPALFVVLAFACAGLDEQQEARLEVHRENARSYFDRGDNERALHQATMALELVPDDALMRLIRANSLLRLGTATRNPALLDDSLVEFEELSSDQPDDDRVALGLGSAHLARALMLQDEMQQTQKRLDSEFLSESGQAAERARLEQQEERRMQHLQEAEAALEDVLAHPLQKDNLLALTQLVLVLHAQRGRDAEALPLADRALVLLDESSGIMRTNLDKNTKLSAAARVDLEQRLKANRERELSVRDLLATAALNRGDTEGFLLQMSLLEERGLLGEVQYWNRAGVLEKLGRNAEAIADLEQFLKLRSQRFPNYEADDMAPEVYRRIETLRAQPAATPSP